MQAYPVTEQDQPEMFRSVQELSQRAGQPKPRLYVSPTLSPSALATAVAGLITSAAQFLMFFGGGRGQRNVNPLAGQRLAPDDRRPLPEPEGDVLHAPPDDRPHSASGGHG